MINFFSEKIIEKWTSSFCCAGYNPARALIKWIAIRCQSTKDCNFFEAGILYLK